METMILMLSNPGPEELYSNWTDSKCRAVNGSSSVVGELFSSKHSDHSTNPPLSVNLVENTCFLNTEGGVGGGEAFSYPSRLSQNEKLRGPLSKKVTF